MFTHEDRTTRAIAERWAIWCAMLAVLVFEGYATVTLGRLLIDLASVNLFAS